MKLPAELRHMVYRHAQYGTESGGCIQIVSRKKCDYNGPERRAGILRFAFSKHPTYIRFSLRLLSVSRQVFSEAVPYLYMNHLSFPSLLYLQQFLLQRMAHVRHLNRISVDVEIRCKADELEVPLAFLSGAHVLQKLKLGYLPRKRTPQALLRWLHEGNPSRFGRVRPFLEGLGGHKGQPSDAIDVLDFSFCRQGREGGDVCGKCQSHTHAVREGLKEAWKKSLLPKKSGNKLPVHKTQP